jgi:hypothetical protein
MNVPEGIGPPKQLVVPCGRRRNGQRLVSPPAQAVEGDRDVLILMRVDPDDDVGSPPCLLRHKHFLPSGCACEPDRRTGL